MIAIVTGMIATYPVGGVAWDYAQYAVGLEQLGWEVYYLEDTGWQSYDPRIGEYGEDYSYGVKFLAEALAELSPTLANRWHVRDMNGGAHGVDAQRFNELARRADLFLNVSGGTLLRDEYMRCPRKVLIDTDPGWNHFVNYPKWDANPGWQGTHGYRAHDYFFTYAERIGRPDCVLPTLGIPWHPTRPLVLLDRWEGQGPTRAWTTVMTWDNFRRGIEYQGVTYGTKELEFSKVEAVPSLVAARFELASGGSGAPRERWEQQGWSVVNSEEISRSANDYREYIQRSRGEFSVAKNVYVATRSGWFSCRSVCYLASGLPVVIQDTGFSEIIPCGRGLLAFADQSQAVEAIRTVEADYSGHRRAAKEIARNFFDSRVVLNGLLTLSG
jgi:hypothetical protein